MADIDVVPKKGGMGWLMWVILALIAVVVVWMMMRGGESGPSSSATPFGFDGPAAQVAQSDLS